MIKLKIKKLKLKMNNLYNYLITKKSDTVMTHVSLFSPKGKFNIEFKKEFWRLYNLTETTKGIAELASYTKTLPILIDYDLKLENVNNIQFLQMEDKFYTIEHVKNIVRIYQKVLREIIQDVKEEHLYCVLLEKKAYFWNNNNIEEQNKYIKNGFHLHFPFIFLNKLNHEIDLLPRIKLEIKKLNSNELPTNMNSVESSIDKAYIKNPWLLYGCKKENNMDPYTITKIFDEHSREIENWKLVFKDYILYDDDNVPIPINLNNLEEYLPQILSIYLNNRFEYLYQVKDNLILINNNHNKNNAIAKIPKIVYNQDINQKKDLIENLMDCLSQERADDRNEWIQVGWILYNIYNGSKEGFDMWCKFSKKSVKYDEATCINEWDKMINKELLTIGSLKYIAKFDNEENYKKLIKDYSDHIYDRNIKMSGSHNDLALILFNKYEQEFICGSITYNMWFQFKNHVWNKDEDGVSLRKKISDELVQDFQNIANKLYENLKDEDECDGVKKKFKNVMKLIGNLKSAPYKTNIMKECKEIFYNPIFISKLDTDPYLIGFANGIYDIKNHIFREGKPTDNLSIKMKINYHEYPMNSNEIKEIERYFEKIFPDKEVREYFLDTSADIFIGGNFNKTVQIWTGDGDNGKSITQSLFEQMLGPYNVKLPTSLITGKRAQSSAACPELVRAGNGVRLAMLQEPDKKDTINIGILKELSGNDTFFARGLYKEGQDINPMFKLILVCNEPPSLTYSDKATWNRIKLIPFESTFTDEAPENYEEQLLVKKFPKDPKFKDKIPLMIEPLAFYLLRRLKDKPLIQKIPLKVTLATENYRQKNDVFKQYISEWIEFKEGAFCNQQEMYQSFRDWFKESFPDHSCPDKNEFIEYFIRLWGPMNSRQGWIDRHIRGIVDYS